MPSASHRFVEHTSELQLELEAPTREDVLAEAAVALGSLLAAGAPGGARVRRAVRATASDDGALLAAWLEELIFLVEAEGLVPDHAEEIVIDGETASGVVAGVLGEPPHLVKAVTYHLLDLSFDGRSWHGRVVLDV